jgi:hypothetical protein
MRRRPADGMPELAVLALIALLAGGALLRGAEGGRPSGEGRAERVGAVAVALGTWLEQGLHAPPGGGERALPRRAAPTTAARWLW